MIQKNTLPFTHFLLALAVVSIWGTNFVVIKLALGQWPPLLFAALRFTLVLLPAIFFLPRPQLPWQNLAQYGVLIGIGQFALLYLAINGHISPGIASLVLQTQVFFTIGLSMRLTGERVRIFQWGALTLATIGMMVILEHTDGSTTPLGLLLVLLAALSWALGNITAKKGGTTNMLAYVAWSNLYSLPPLFALAFCFEGPSLILKSLTHASLAAWLAVAWQAWGNSLFGYVAWAWLLARHPTAVITPLALLVPLFGIGTSALLLNESLPMWKFVAMAFVMSGLALNLLWPRFLSALQGRRRTAIKKWRKDTP